MRLATTLLLLLGSVIAGHTGAADLRSDAPRVCDDCAAWNAPRAPFRIYGNCWYVGPAGLASILITSPDGHILIDGGLPQSAPLIARNIAAAGFRLDDVKLILNSHTHYDHAGGIAALARASGARVAASPAATLALQSGAPTPDDPQFAFGRARNAFPAVPQAQAIRDRETLRVGALAVTAHFTAGHTPGGTTWTWRSCEDRDGAPRCLDIVYADSLNPVAAPGFHFRGDAQQPDVAGRLAQSIEHVAQLPCDILLAPHPGLVDLDAKLDRLKSTPAINPFIDPDACRAYATAALARLTKRLADEASGR